MGVLLAAKTCYEHGGAEGHLRGESLFGAMRNVSFLGASGPVAFDEHGNRANVTLNLHQVQAGQLVLLGHLVRRRLDKSPRHAIFPDGGTNPRNYDASPRSISDFRHHSFRRDQPDCQTWLLAFAMALSAALVVITFQAFRRPVHTNLPQSRPARTPFIDTAVAQS